ADTMVAANSGRCSSSLAAHRSAVPTARKAIPTMNHRARVIQGNLAAIPRTLSPSAEPSGVERAGFAIISGTSVQFFVFGTFGEHFRRRYGGRAVLSMRRVRVFC